MPCSQIRFGLFAAMLGLLALLVSPANEADATGLNRGDNFTFHGSSERPRGWTGPHCDNPSVLSKVRNRFDRTEATYWDSGLTMDAIGRPREIAFRDWTPTIIATRSCRADAELSNGRNVGIVYWVRSEQGFAGKTYGVDYCVLGMDRTYSFAPSCRSLLPR